MNTDKKNSDMFLQAHAISAQDFLWCDYCQKNTETQSFAGLYDEDGNVVHGETICLECGEIIIEL